MSVAVFNAPEQNRYEARDGSTLAGLAAYQLTATGLIVFTHTEVNPAYTGKGVGSHLARAALDDARAREFRVLPLVSVHRRPGRPAPELPRPRVPPAGQRSPRLKADHVHRNARYPAPGITAWSTSNPAPPDHVVEAIDR